VKVAVIVAAAWIALDCALLAAWMLIPGQRRRKVMVMFGAYQNSIGGVMPGEQSEVDSPFWVMVLRPFPPEL
jgi:hypothetical protein